MSFHHQSLCVFDGPVAATGGAPRGGDGAAGHGQAAALPRGPGGCSGLRRVLPATPRRRQGSPQRRRVPPGEGKTVGSFTPSESGGESEKHIKEKTKNIKGNFRSMWMGLKIEQCFKITENKMWARNKYIFCIIPVVYHWLNYALSRMYFVLNCACMHVRKYVGQTV